MIIFFYEVIRFRTANSWWRWTQGKIYRQTIANILSAILIWHIMDIFFEKEEDINCLGIVLFTIHVLFLVSLSHMIYVYLEKVRWFYAPVFLEGISFICSIKMNMPKLLFPGVWGMYAQSRRQRYTDGFSEWAALIIQLTVMLGLYVWGGRRIRR